MKLRKIITMGLAAIMAVSAMSISAFAANIPMRSEVDTKAASADNPVTYRTEDGIKITIYDPNISLDFAEKEEPELDIWAGKHYGPCDSFVSEHFTQPPKQYTEDTLLSAMERAGNEELTEDTEKKGLGTPATRAAIIEKLIQSGFVKREKKNLVPTDDGNVLITVLPDEIKSPKMTAEWEMALNHIAQNTETADEFLNGITELMQELVARYQGISEEKKNQFQGKAKGEVIGKCPRCGADVREGKVNFYCSDRKCAFTLWKNDKFLASQGKKMDKVAAKKFLSKGKIHYKDLVSRKTGRQYEATVEMVDPGEGNVQFNLIFPQR